MTSTMHRRCDRSRFASHLLTAITIGLLAVTNACRQSTRDLASMVNVADESKARQLIAGFHAIEQKQWRWTSRRFRVMLKPPRGAEQHGAILTLEFYLPPSQIKRLGPMTLLADAGGYPLEPETFSTAGRFTYSRVIPAPELDTNILPVDFCFDKALSDAADDGRELAAVASAVGLRTR